MSDNKTELSINTEVIRKMAENQGFLPIII